jgi:heat shock protein HtpX
MVKKPAPNFYDIQQKQWEKSLFLLLILILFYFFAVGLISIIFLLSFGFLTGKGELFSGSSLFKLLAFTSALSFIIAFFHFFEARKFGAKLILKRLEAQPPDLADRYHKQLADTVEEIRIASGLPKVTPLIMPSSAINSMALIAADNTPNVVVTEGLLAEFTRDELEAVASHEIAHIIRGDAFYITLVCSLANFFERLREALEPEKPIQAGSAQTERGGGSPLLYLVVSFSALIMRLLSTLVSREREILADAASVELCRNPKALARAIYKAHLKNSFVGDFNLTYSPLFIVPPESSGESDGFFARLFSSHPPLMKRIRLLADMAGTRPAGIIEEVWEIQKKREKARTVLHSREEAVKGIPREAQSPEEAAQQEGKTWLIRDPKGDWQGPFALGELLFLRFFTSMIQVKNLQEGIEAPAREFPQIRDALRRIGRKKPIDPARQNRCPRCQLPLVESFYEGVALRFCPQCGGKLVDSAFMDRILARKEVAFSEQLIKKAMEFKEKFMLNPIHTMKISQQKPQNLFCPNCGTRMLPRPYNYQYFIPVDKCLSCYKIWFDADELEILQILIEKR